MADIDELMIEPGVKSVFNWDTLLITEVDLATDEIVREFPIPDHMLPLKESRAVAAAQAAQVRAELEAREQERAAALAVINTPLTGTTVTQLRAQAEAQRQATLTLFQP